MIKLAFNRNNPLVSFAIDKVVRETIGTGGIVEYYVGTKKDESVTPAVVTENFRTQVMAFESDWVLVPIDLGNENMKLQSKEVTPAVTSQTIKPDSTYDALDSVIVDAVTSDIDSNIIKANIREGVSILGVEGNLAPDKPDQTKTFTPDTTGATIEPDTGYELASVTVYPVTSAVDANIVSDNIKNGVEILGVTGSVVELDPETITIPPSTVEDTYTPQSGNGFTSVTVNAVTSSIDPNIVASNIKKDVTILGVTGDLESGTTINNGVEGQYKSSGAAIPAGNFVSVIDEWDITDNLMADVNSTGVNIKLTDTKVVTLFSKAQFIEGAYKHAAKASLTTLNNDGTATEGTVIDIDPGVMSTQGVVIKGTKLTDSTILVLLTYTEDSWLKLYGVVGTITNNTITFGQKTPLVTSSYNLSSASDVIGISDSTALILYKNNSQYLEAMAVSVSGTTITTLQSSTVVSATNSAAGLLCLKLDTNKAIIIHNAGGGSTVMKGFVCTYDSSNNTIAAGTDTDVTGSGQSASYRWATVLSSSKFVVGGVSNSGVYGGVCSVNSYNITPGTYSKIDNGYETYDPISATVDADNFLVGYRTQSTMNLKVTKFNVTGTTISATSISNEVSRMSGSYIRGLLIPLTDDKFWLGHDAPSNSTHEMFSYIDPLAKKVVAAKSTCDGVTKTDCTTTTKGTVVLLDLAHRYITLPSRNTAYGFNATMELYAEANVAMNRWDVVINSIEVTRDMAYDAVNENCNLRIIQDYSSSSSYLYTGSFEVNMAADETRQYVEFEDNKPTFNISGLSSDYEHTWTGVLSGMMEVDAYTTELETYLPAQR